MPDIPLQSESEFTSDMVKAVENIAANVKLGSSEFSDSIGMLSKAIDGLKSSLIESINSLKSSANNSAPVSASAAPRASQGRSTSAQDPAVARAKEEEKRIKAETKALNIKTAQERAIFNAKKLQLQIESVNEGKTTRRKKTDADTQQQTIEEVFENVGKGFGDVFAVTKEQVSAMTKSGKKGGKDQSFSMDMGSLSTTKESESFKNIAEGFGALFAVTKEQISGMKKSGKKGGKEKPFEMDMGALSTDKKAGPGVDIPENFVKDINASSDAWNNVFSNVSKTAKQWKEIGQQQKSLMDAFQSVGDGFGEVFAVTKEQMADMRKSGKKGGKEKPFNMDMGALSSSAISEFEMLFQDLASAFSAGSKGTENNSEVVDVAYEDALSLVSQINAMLGDATEQAQELNSALDLSVLMREAQDAIDDLNPDLPELNEFEKLFNDLGDMFNNVQIDPGFNENVIDLSNANSLAESSVKALIDSVLNLTTASGLGIDIADGVLEGSQDAANIIGDTFRKELNQLARTAPGEKNLFIEDLSQQATDLAVSFGLLMKGIHSGDANIAGFSDAIDFAVSSVSRLIDSMNQVSDQKGENFVGPTQLTGPTQEGEEDYAAKKQREDRENQIKAEDALIRQGVSNFSSLFESMFGKMGKSVENVIATTMSGINQSFSDKSWVFDSVKSMFGFSSVNKNSETPKAQTLSSGGTVGYFAKGTPKGGVFEGIGSVLGGKKKKKKSLLNNDEGDFSSIFKPKGTDTVPAMLTPGEEVVKKSAAEKPENKQVIDAMNKSSGGKVGYFAGGTPGGGGKGLVGGLASLALGPVGQAFSVLTGSVKAASDAIGMFGSFVAKNNPAVMEQVNLAMNDLQGAIGRGLVPMVQALLPVLRYMGDGVDFIMKMLMPAINPLVNAFKTLAMPLIEMETVVAQFLAPAFEIVAIAVEGFAIMLDPVIQLVSEIIETFTEIINVFGSGAIISKAMIDGFQILGQIVKMIVGALVGVLGLFVSGMGVILQGLGKMISWIPGLGDIGKSIQKGGESLQKTGEDQRDRGLAKIKEGATNIVGKMTDPNYKMKDNTRYKPGDVTGVGMKKGSSVGAAVREVQSTSISGVGDEIRKQALMAATGAKTQEESLAEIAKGLSKQNLADAVKAGVIAANADNKGGPPIVGGNNPMRRPKPLMAPV